jgi:hypothetical protein
MSVRVPAKLRRQAEQRAEGRCEYCLFHQEDTFLAHEPDHVVANQHGGATEESNLAWACFECNRFQGSNLSSIDSTTGNIERLFNPRADSWGEHFQLEEARIVPRTSIGRATEFLLRFNAPDNIELRCLLIEAGRFQR